MKLQQLKCLHQVVQRNFSISKTAEALHISQPTVSKQILLLEAELGVQIFKRHGKRLGGLTAVGEQVLALVENVLRDTTNIQRIAEEFGQTDIGHLSIAATHTQARYKLPEVVKAFMARYPKVSLSIHQGNPTQVATLVMSGEADIGIATEVIGQMDGLRCIPCYEWNRCVIVPRGHPLLSEKTLDLQTLASYPLITYDGAFTGSTLVAETFAKAGIVPNVVLTAIDADVIKTYVSLGLGVGLLAQMAVGDNLDSNLASIDVAHLFPNSTSYIGVRKDAFLRAYTLEFMALLAPQVERKTLNG